jgi:D-3-phosphoglycerate dehydrogenase / 2-oxoglutarate reductase
MTKVLITTIPFGQADRRPLDYMESQGIDYVINPLGRKIRPEELLPMLDGVEALVAGTEPITDQILSEAKTLKMISRVGIGLDSVDLLATRKRSVKVSYTPEGPAPAVAELTIALSCSLLRGIHISNNQIRNGIWGKYIGRSLSGSTFGIIGINRIGVRVLDLLQGLGVKKILINDIQKNPSLEISGNVEWVSKERLFEEADVISLHVPLTELTENMIAREQLLLMKPDAMIVNTSRGGIINEDDLYDVMKDGHLAGAALDVFEKEPYEGKLREIERCLLTAHIGSMTRECRSMMEWEAVEDVVRFLKGEVLLRPVPEREYEARMQYQ